jgi:hypothetical protein
MNREILFPTPIYFKDLPNAKELINTYIKKLKLGTKLIQRVRLKLIQDLVGIVKPI